MRSVSSAMATGICLLVAGAVAADETPMVGIGGTYRPIRGEPPVRLVREFVRVRLDPRQASTVVQFEFRNEGPAQVVTMGFPEQVIYARASYERFRVEVDGRPAPAKPTRWVETSSQTEWTRWWVHRVRFARAERRIVRVSYHERPARDDDGSYNYGYLLGSGRAWKGPIGRVDVVIRLEDLPAGASVYAEPAPGARRGDVLAWRFENFEPDPDFRLDATVWPYITDVAINGEEVSEDSFRIRQDVLEADLWELALWSASTTAWHDQEKTGFIHRERKTLALTAESAQALLLPAKTGVRLPFAPYLEGGRLRVPVRAVCEALGLRVQIAKDQAGNYRVQIGGEKQAR